MRPFVWGVDTGRSSLGAGTSSSGSSNGGGVMRDCVSGRFVDARTDPLGAVLLSLFRSAFLSFSSSAVVLRDKWDL